MNHDSIIRAAPVSFSFTSQLANLKNTLTLWEDVVSKTMKLSAALRTVIQCIAGFLEAFQKIADSAYGSNCGLRDLGSCMTRFCLRERGLESRLRTFNSQLMDCLAQPLSDRLEEWRRTVTQLERENNKEWRRARSELQRVTSEVEKLNKRFRRKGSSSSSAHGDCGSNCDSNSPNPAQTGENVQLNFVHHDLAVKRRTLSELERTNLRRAVVEERRRFAELLTCLKPVLDSQTAIFGDVTSIDECILAISKHMYDPNELPSDTEQAVEEAADQVSVSQTTYERKLSDVRSMMRLGKGGNANSFDAMSLRRTAGYCSQLSLQSSASATNSTWNSVGSSMVTSSGKPNHRFPSTINTHGEVDCVKAKNIPQSPQSPSSRSGCFGPTDVSATATDCFSLFEHADASHKLECHDSGTTQLPPPAPNDHCSSRDSHADVNPTTIDSAPSWNGRDPASVTLYAENPNSTNGTQDEEEEDEDADTGGVGDGGATTEDTEDGETEDDERIHAINGSKCEAKPSSILYPNQAIPAPVYTNLNELKRAAARKFRNAETADNHNNNTGQTAPHATLEDPTTIPSDMPAQVSPYATATTGADLRLPISEVYAALGFEQGSTKPPFTQPPTGQTEVTVTENSSAINLPPCGIDSTGGGGNTVCTSYMSGPNDGFIATQVNSGTSTFRRRQSEYAKRQPSDSVNSPTGLGHMSRILNYASPTPAVVRRGSQACTDVAGRRTGRPTNPPRRSSSVSREFSHTIHSGLSEPLGTVYVTQTNRPNGVDHPGIQRVSSSIFAHGNQALPNQVINGTATAHGPRPNLIQLPPGTMIRPSAMSTNMGVSPTFYSEASTTRSDRARGMPLTPPPLATVAAPMHSKTNQLMFGVKVLPSQIPGLPTDPSNTSPSSIVNYGTVSRQSERHRYNMDNSSGHYASASRLHRMPNEDGSTSFIE